MLVSHLFMVRIFNCLIGASFEVYVSNAFNVLSFYCRDYLSYFFFLVTALALCILTPAFASCVLISFIPSSFFYMLKCTVSAFCICGISICSISDTIMSNDIVLFVFSIYSMSSSSLNFCVLFLVSPIYPLSLSTLFLLSNSFFMFVSIQALLYRSFVAVVSFSTLCNVIITRQLTLIQ